jgi:hypothetical protein
LTNRRKKYIGDGSGGKVPRPKKKFSILGPFFLASQTIWFPVLRKNNLIKWKKLIFWSRVISIKLYGKTWRKKKFASFWKLKNIWLKFQEKNSVRKKKHMLLHCYFLLHFFSRWITTLFQHNFIKFKALMHIKVIFYSHRSGENTVK